MLIKEEILLLPTGAAVTLRSATAADAELIARHRLITSGETCFMARYPEECNFDLERMRRVLSDTALHPVDFTVTAFVNGEVIGDLGVNRIRENLKYRHRSYMGMSVLRAYWGLGLGGKMLDRAIAQAKANGFEQLELGVFEDNAHAIGMYTKHGFERFGIQPRAFKLKDGTYRDELIMVHML